MDLETISGNEVVRCKSCGETFTSVCPSKVDPSQTQSFRIWHKLFLARKAALQILPAQKVIKITPLDPLTAEALETRLFTVCSAVYSIGVSTRFFFLNVEEKGIKTRVGLVFNSQIDGLKMMKVLAHMAHKTTDPCSCLEAQSSEEPNQIEQIRTPQELATFENLCRRSVLTTELSELKKPPHMVDLDDNDVSALALRYTRQAAECGIKAAMNIHSSAVVSPDSHIVSTRVPKSATNSELLIRHTGNVYFSKEPTDCYAFALTIVQNVRQAGLLPRLSLQLQHPNPPVRSVVLPPGTQVDHHLNFHTHQKILELLGDNLPAFYSRTIDRRSPVFLVEKLLNTASKPHMVDEHLPEPVREVQRKKRTAKFEAFRHDFFLVYRELFTPLQLFHILFERVSLPIEAVELLHYWLDNYRFDDFITPDGDGEELLARALAFFAAGSQRPSYLPQTRLSKVEVDRLEHSILALLREPVPQPPNLDHIPLTNRLQRISQRSQNEFLSVRLTKWNEMSRSAMGSADRLHEFAVLQFRAGNPAEIGAQLCQDIQTLLDLNDFGGAFELHTSLTALANQHGVPANQEHPFRFELEKAQTVLNSAFNRLIEGTDPFVPLWHDFKRRGEQLYTRWELAETTTFSLFLDYARLIEQFRELQLRFKQ